MASVDLPLVQTILEPFVVGLMLFLAQRVLERRVRLVVYYGNFVRSCGGVSYPCIFFSRI